MNVRLTLAKGIAALALVAVTGPAMAQSDSLGADWRQQQGEARAKVKSGNHISLERVVAEIRKRTPGRMLDAGLETGPDGRSVYRVRWAAADGRRVDFLVDAANGQILSGG
jgi:uncharacterized membrane protein YkoI